MQSRLNLMKSALLCPKGITLSSSNVILLRTFFELIRIFYINCLIRRFQTRYCFYVNTTKSCYSLKKLIPGFVVQRSERRTDVDRDWKNAGHDFGLDFSRNFQGDVLRDQRSQRTSSQFEPIKIEFDGWILSEMLHIDSEEI